MKLKSHIWYNSYSNFCGVLIFSIGGVALGRVFVAACAAGLFVVLLVIHLTTTQTDLEKDKETSQLID